MKIKSEIFVLLIIICILFSISAVSASEIQSDVNEDNNHQSNMELNQDSGNLNSKLNSGDIEDISGVSKTDNIKSSYEDNSSFTALAKEINQSQEYLNLTHDYKFNESIDKDNLEDSGLLLITVEKDKLVLNGNNHVIDGAGSGAYLYFENAEGEIIINDLTFKNYNQTVLKTWGKLTLNNVNFTDFNNTIGNIIISNDVSLIVNNCSFYSNNADHLIKGEYSTTIINNSRFYGNNNKGAAILVNRWQLIIQDSYFENFSYKNGAMIEFKGDRFEIINSKFINAQSDLSGGAILGKYFPNIYGSNPSSIQNYPFLFKDCVFANLSCGNNGGTIHIDLDSASRNIPKTMNVINSNFTDCKSKFGGAISILGGTLNINECNFINNTASFEGGAIYSSWTNLNISKSNFTNNTATKNAGAIYFDKHKLTITQSNFKDNNVLNGAFNASTAIYAHDVEAHFSDSTFDNGGVAVYADFASDSKIENVEKNNDIFLMDNHDYIVSVENKGIKINLTNNEIIVDTLPPRFDARDWGWTTPGKVQGDNDDCWAFATVATLETALGKSTGIAYNLSQNYVQKLQLKYYYIGDLRNSLTGFSYSGLGYALSWYGVLPIDAPYDDRGMIADTDMNVERIHVQDAMFIYTGTNDTIDQLKRAILKYGAVSVQVYVEEPSAEIPTEGEDIALMDHGTHFISLIGWDDNALSYFGQKGVWITKDSLFGFSQTPYTTFPQIDYYAIVPQRVAVAYIFENANDYHVNYQTDLTGLVGFDENYTYYSNEFTSKYTELIGAVGTYFNESGINYSFDIFVNDEKVHSQNGVSEFAGFRTIVLNNNIPVKAGDKFKVVFKSNSVPYQAWSRVHYMEGISLASADGTEWSDFAPLNKTVCLKVYTLKIDDESSFTTLAQEISQSTDELNLTHDYKFNESIDYYVLTDEYKTTEIEITNDKLVINGNGHVIDGAGKGARFNFENRTGQIIINNLTFKNFNVCVLIPCGNLILNNVNFTGCLNNEKRIISMYEANMTLNNCSFYSNDIENIINAYQSNLIINNSSFYGNNSYGSAILLNRGELIIAGSIFENFTYKNGAAFDFKGHRFEVSNSIFRNIHSELSGGAIIAKYFPLIITKEGGGTRVPSGPILIQDCTFDNITCGNDGGAIHIDLDSASHHIQKTMNVINSNFTDCKSKFGGAISILGGTLNINECNFINNTANFEGGAIYSSWTNLNISKSNFRNNSANKTGGAIYFDKHKLTINKSNFTANNVLEESLTSANAIYAHDVEIHFSDSTFDNGGVAVYADFASDSKIENVEKNNDIFLMDNHNYIVSVETKGIKLNFTKNEIIVDTLPSRFDSRDWGWVTPGKIQGDNDDCWAFATVASIETALGKSTGTLYNLSQNYVQKLQLKYYNIGDLRNSLTGFSYSGLGYALSWYGVLPIDAPYDDRGMIADTDMNVERIHVQDAMFIYTGMNDTIEQLKSAIMKYGAVTVQYWIYNTDSEIPSEGEDIAIMDHTTHFVSLIGWDDNYVYEYEETDGGWICKNSLSGFNNFSYDNFSEWDNYAIVPQRVAVAYIFENTIDYHVNYQTDLTGLVGFDENYTYYSNEFTSKYEELIGAVGTYFNESGINYSFDIFVNGKKVHSQSGISEFAGFRTIVLDKYIPVKKGDQFKVVFKSNSVPYQAWSRVHYMNGTSLVSKDSSSWIDFAPLNKTVCLKVYTVKDDSKIINNKNIAVDYSGGKYFSVKVVSGDGHAVVGASVKFNINGKTTTVKTDSNGIAKIKITQLPKKYTMTTTYNGKSVKNTVTVKQVLTAYKVTVKKTAKRFILKAKLKINGKLVKGKVITFKFKGKTYKVKTNAKGIAQKTLNKKVIKKLKKGKTYTVKVTYLKDTIKSSVKLK